MTLDDQYEEWMFNNLSGSYCRNTIVEMYENSDNWEDFLEDLGQDELEDTWGDE